LFMSRDTASVKLRYYHSLGVKTDNLKLSSRDRIKPKKSELFCFSINVIFLFLIIRMYRVCGCGVADVRQKCR